MVNSCSTAQQAFMSLNGKIANMSLTTFVLVELSSTAVYTEESDYTGKRYL
jgi:hypothetical protein